MRRTGNIMSLPATGMCVAATLKGVLPALWAGPDWAQPASAPAPSAAAVCKAVRRSGRVGMGASRGGADPLSLAPAERRARVNALGAAVQGAAAAPSPQLGQ